jgi:hypothetical protein
MMKPLRWIKLFSINNNVASMVEESGQRGEIMEHVVGDKDGMEYA